MIQMICRPGPPANRLQQSESNESFSSDNGSCTSSGSTTTEWASYSAQNQMTQTNAPNVTPYTPSYDAAGDVTQDANNTYLYDADGQLCAVNAVGVGMIGYLYDASGNRVAKGTITSWSCDISQNGFQQTAGFVVGGGGAQLTEVDGGNNWKHTNLWLGGKQFGSYDQQGLHFYFDDPLGTRRAQANSAGVLEAVYQSLPYGDDLVSSGTDDPTENHFTGYEQDAESGNDFAQARYYGAVAGRFVSPDLSGLTYAHFTNPQSLNLYAYATNGPLAFVDPSGMDGCQIDGVDTSCSLVENNEGVVHCPANLCNGVAIGTYGNAKFYEFAAGGGGSEGFVSVGDQSGSVNEWGGQFVDDQQYASNLNQEISHEIYEAYMLGLSKGNMDSGGPQSVYVRLVGSTYNVQIPNDQLSDTNGWHDPLSSAHNGESSIYYADRFGLVTGTVGHVAAGVGDDVNYPGLEAHYDSPGPLNPAHWLLDYLPSLLIHPRRNAQAVPYTCVAGVGCW